MQWLLDTCVISELTRKAPNATVTHWLMQHARNALQQWFDGLCTQFSARTLATDDAVWRTYGRLKASVESIGRPQEDLDLLIAATAAVHQLTVVTRNVKHFEDTGIKIFNPWLPVES